MAKAANDRLTIHSQTTLKDRKKSWATCEHTEIHTFEIMDKVAVAVVLKLTNLIKIRIREGAPTPGSLRHMTDAAHNCGPGMSHVEDAGLGTHNKASTLENALTKSHMGLLRRPPAPHELEPSML